MNFSTTDLPQADVLDKVVQTVHAVENGAKTDLQIANEIGFTDRQGRYYRHAAEILGLITNHDNNAVITEFGSELVKAEFSKEKNILQQAILNNDLFKTILHHVEQFAEGTTRGAIEEFIYGITINPSISTISRRLSTLLKWLVDPKIELLVKRKEIYFFNPILIVNDEDTLEEDTYEQGTYPRDSYSNELDIREEYLTVFGLLRKINQQTIKLNPDFQRNLVWNQKQKSKFIESLLLNIPLPPLYVSEDISGNYIIVDGLQRTSTLKDFFEGKFTINGLEALPNLNGKYFSELEPKWQIKLEDKNILLYILRPSVPLVVVYDIFNRINTGGTPLNRQEIRNCIYIGQSTSLIKELADYEEFKNAIDYGISQLRMKDREAVLRYLAFTMLDWENEYNNDMDEFLGKAMKKLNDMKLNEILNIKRDFKRTMSLTFDFFAYENFRLPSQFGRGRINIAILESIGYFFSKHTDSYLLANKYRIVDNYFKKLLTNPLYIDSVKSSTGSTLKVKTRFNRSTEILTKG